MLRTITATLAAITVALLLGATPADAAPKKIKPGHTQWVIVTEGCDILTQTCIVHVRKR